MNAIEARKLSRIYKDIADGMTVQVSVNGAWEAYDRAKHGPLEDMNSTAVRTRPEPRDVWIYWPPSNATHGVQVLKKREQVDKLIELYGGTKQRVVES